MNECKQNERSSGENEKEAAASITMSIQMPPSPFLQICTSKNNKSEPSKKKWRITKDPLMALLTGATLVVLIVYTCFTRQLVIDGRRSTAEQSMRTIESNSQNKDLFLAHERPWVKIEGVTMNGDIVFFPNIVNIPIAISYNNIGVVPATNITGADFDVIPIMMAPDMLDINSRVKRACAISKHVNPDISEKIGMFLFPGDKTRALSPTGGISDEHFSKFLGKSNAGHITEVVIIVHATYQSPLDNRAHCSAQAFNLIRTDGKALFPIPADEKRADGGIPLGAIPMDKIRLSKTIFGGTYAD